MIFQKFVDLASSNIRRSLWLCYILAVVVRLAFVLEFPGPNYFGGVSERCLDVGKNVVEGKGFVFYVNVAPFGSPDNYRYEPFIDKPIGYPSFIAAVFFIFGIKPVAVQLVQAFLLSLGCVVVYRILRLLKVDEVKSLLGAFLCAVWPNHARFEVTILPEAMMPFILILTSYLLLRAIEPIDGNRQKWGKKSLQNSLMAGFVLGLGSLSRPDVMFLPIWLFIGLALIYSFRVSLRILWPATLVFYAIIGLHTVRNYLLTDEIIPLGYSNGTVLWQGISQFGDTLGTVYSDYRIAHHEGYPSLLYPNGIERDRKRFREAVNIIESHPLFYLSLIPRRIPLLLVPRGLLVQDDPAPRTNDKEDFPQHFQKGILADFRATPIRALIKVFSALSGVILLFLALLGYWKSRVQSRGVGVLLLFMLYFVAVLLPINAEARYFFPAVILLFPMSVMVLANRSQISPRQE
ncbi:MAG: glycosyltransferase family 39 protein [Bacteroidetes bacterium]|nr:glycosyltransferase family 39 protein [Bacteroidota bacterium]